MKESKWKLIGRAYSIWSDHEAMGLAASVAFYTMMSIAPLLVIALNIAGLKYGHDAAEKVGQQMNVLVGSKQVTSPGGVIHALLDSAGHSKHGLVASIVSFVIAMVSGSTLFVSLQDALNNLWDVSPRRSLGWRVIVRNRLAAGAMLLVAAILLLASFVLSATLSMIVHHLGVWISGLSYGADTLVSFVIATLLFATIFKVLPAVKSNWTDVWFGAGITAVLFIIGKFGLAVYFKLAAVQSPYGAAGSLAALLIWVYYSAGLMFFGAALTRAWVESRGRKAEPTDYAVARPT